MYCRSSKGFMKALYSFTVKMCKVGPMLVVIMHSHYHCHISEIISYDIITIMIALDVSKCSEYVCNNVVITITL